jgi:RNA polymerase sigma-70 factor, ECF subfamily
VSSPETAWIHGAQKGDAEAFTNLLESYQKPVYNLCYRMLGDELEAEDAAQETFLRAYKNLRRYDSQRSFSTWLLSISAHYCIDQIRKRRYTVYSYDESADFEPPDKGPGPEASYLIAENQARVQALLASLNPQDRAAVVMRYWSELSYEEIADALDLTVSAVKSRLFRARKELAATMMEQKENALLAERKRHESPVF